MCIKHLPLHTIHFPQRTCPTLKQDLYSALLHWPCASCSSWSILRATTQCVPYSKLLCRCCGRDVFGQVQCFPVPLLCAPHLCRGETTSIQRCCLCNHCHSHGKPSSTRVISAGGYNATSNQGGGGLASQILFPNSEGKRVWYPADCADTSLCEIWLVRLGRMYSQCISTRQ